MEVEMLSLPCASAPSPKLAFPDWPHLPTLLESPVAVSGKIHAALSLYYDDRQAQN
jgi:hypothetical protein